jgi:molybdopterin-guanine dinucleotide biosynthesis protein B
MGISERRAPFVFQVIGRHNSGKTTLIEYLAGELKKRNYRVGYVKHDPKGKGKTDKEGSDTHRVKPHTKKTALVSPELLTLWWFERLTLRRVLKLFEDCDVIIVEGFKFERGYPKVLVGELEEDVRDRIDEIALTVNSRDDYERVLNWILKEIEKK